MNAPALSARGLTVRFGGLVALNDVSFDIGPGEIVGIIGPNGAGKTTLFNALIGVQKTTSGHIEFRGRRFQNPRPHEVARAGMTKTFQNAALFRDMSVLENVMTAALVHDPINEARMQAQTILEQLGLRSIAEQRIETLTFPQKAMVELARALATRPGIVLLDEVMAALTHTEMDEVMRVIQRLRTSGLSFLVVEHHMRAIMSLCDRLLVLTFGTLIAQGKPSEVVSNPEVIRAYLGTSVDGAGAIHA